MFFEHLSQAEDIETVYREKVQIAELLDYLKTINQVSQVADKKKSDFVDLGTKMSNRASFLDGVLISSMHLADGASL